MSPPYPPLTTQDWRAWLDHYVAEATRSLEEHGELRIDFIVFPRHGDVMPLSGPDGQEPALMRDFVQLFATAHDARGVCAMNLALASPVDDPAPVETVSLLVTLAFYDADDVRQVLWCAGDVVHDAGTVSGVTNVQLMNGEPGGLADMLLEDRPNFSRVRVAKAALAKFKRQRPS